MHLKIQADQIWYLHDFSVQVDIPLRDLLEVHLLISSLFACHFLFEEDTYWSWLRIHNELVPIFNENFQPVIESVWQKLHAQIIHDSSLILRNGKFVWISYPVVETHYVDFFYLHRKLEGSNA